jgi:hypothetical protein
MNQQIGVYTVPDPSEITGRYKPVWLIANDWTIWDTERGNRADRILGVEPMIFDGRVAAEMTAKLMNVAAAII